MECYALFLFLLGILVLTESWAGSHSLRYLETSVSWPELGEPQFIAVAYVDDQQFSSFDSGGTSQRLEPKVPWREKMDQGEPDYWKEKTQVCRHIAQTLQAQLKNLPGYYNQTAGGVHTFQRMYGCEVSPDLTFKLGFLKYAYDGQDYISLDAETYRWTAAVPQAENTKHKWEGDKSFTEGWKFYLEEQCVQILKKYLENGQETLTRTDPPSARVTRHTAHDGEVTLRCRAQDFYPGDISLTWLRDGEAQIQDTESIETRPAGDGTFQKWAAVRMPSGQEGRYTCRVQHEGLPEPLTLKWEPESSSIWVIVGVIAAVLTAVIPGVVIWRHKKSGGKGGDFVPAADNDSAQGSDVSLTAKA
ncbi:popy Class I histocompatibility antigen, A-1 alpha chain-like [Dromiciops gliroides]|uniref:popy Class I histocompatibility antigen, A-1 alpha chain-like n=1 Tax=Dromiciops gliroides TaxID=33562 RepID=UPI001CC3FF2F|nr:popy Class I histocompatibility antigen, A-1 alpha chain-like [Dromiciops gliroides]